MSPAPAPPPRPAILQTVGNTPLLRIGRLAPAGPVEVYAKAEWFNPGGSVKDRAALNMIETAEAEGRLRPGLTLLESTSGNTGIALAMIGAAKGYRVLLVMPSNVTDERKAMVRAFGAEVAWTDPLEGSDGAILEAKRIFRKRPADFFYTDQYNNPANPAAHYRTTAVEIWNQTGGRVTHFVAGIGTSGTLVGTARRLKEFNPAIQVIAAEPAEPVHGLEGLKHMASAIVPGIYDPTAHDRLIRVGTEDAYAAVDRLAAEEGILAGHSSGAALWAALKVAREIPRGVVVTVFPDAGTRYLSRLADEPASPRA